MSFDPKRTVSFVAVDREKLAKGGTVTAFRTYTDRAGVFGPPGLPVFYNDGTRDQRTNQLIGKFFKIDSSHANLTVTQGQKDYDGKTLFDFLKNYPGCEGSKNGTYTTDENGNEIQLGVEYRLADTETDAETILDANTRRAKAQVSASELDDETLTEVASYIGLFGPATKFMRSKVQEWAGKQPVNYFEALNDGERGIRAIIRNSVAKGTLKKTGTLIKWEGNLLGETEDAAVRRLIEQPEILQALQANGNLNAEVPKRRPGRPKKVN